MVFADGDDRVVRGRKWMWTGQQGRSGRSLGMRGRKGLEKEKGWRWNLVPVFVNFHFSLFFGPGVRGSREGELRVELAKEGEVRKEQKGAFLLFCFVFDNVWYG